MSERFLLIAVTVVAVVSDSMLAPFYPQFFADAFGMVSPEHIGAYIAASCLTVMLSCPFWAHVARRVPALRLLVATQLAAGLLCVLCSWTGSLAAFWLSSMGMFLCKGSYLLVYPYLLSREDKEKHAGTIGLLSVIVHFGSIFGAVLCGFLLEAIDPRHIFLVMAAGDFIQVIVCLFLIARQPGDAATPAPATSPEEAIAPAATPIAFIGKLGAIMFLFYFSSFLIRPFFSRYWGSITGSESTVAAGFVFAIPAVVALAGLWFNQRRPKGVPFSQTLPALWLGLFGCLFQAVPSEPVVLVGRCLFGWSMFQAGLRLDLLLFEKSAPAAYATDFSRIHVFQQLGALVASFAAGSLVAAQDLRSPFLAAGLGFLVTVGCYRALFAESRPTRKMLMTYDS